MKIDPNYQQLISLARQAQTKSYAPYSGFKVGAALLADDKHIYLGANIENASYGLSICAERTAVFQAVLAGEKDLQVMAITNNGTGFAYPCGACLQVLAEFAPHIKIIIGNDNLEIREYYLNQLLPMIFSLEKAD